MEKNHDLFWQSAQKKMSEHAAKHGHALEYLEGALQFLVDFLRCPLTGEEWEKYLTRLATYPRVKLEMLTEYTGHISGVWKYLDEVRTDHERESARAEMGSYKQLPHKPRPDIAKDVLQHYTALLAADPHKRDEVERQGIAALREKYPGINFQCGRPGNRTQ
jgi:hypothetical protein